MIQMTAATFEDGVFKPDERLNLPSHSRVRLLVEPLAIDDEPDQQQVWAAIEQLWRHSAINSGGERLSREQLHERR